MGSARTNAKISDKKGEDRRRNEPGRRTKPSTSTQVIDAPIGEEEQIKKQKEEQKTFEPYDLQGLYDDHILNHYPPQGGEKIKLISQK